MTNCPKVYKNLQCESFGDKKKVTSQMLRQFCKNDAYLYDQIKQLWDMTDPESRKRFFPPFFLDLNNSFGIESHILKDCEKARYDYLEYVYRFSQAVQFTKILNFDVNDDGVVEESSIRPKIITEKNDNLCDLDFDGNTKRLEIIRGTDGNYLYPQITDKTIAYTEPDTVIPGTNLPNITKYKKVTKKVETLGKSHRDAYCYGPYKDKNCNTTWYVGFNHNKNYNIKAAWKKDPFGEDPKIVKKYGRIPSICRGQTFTAESTGRISTVSLMLKGTKTSVSDCVVEIRETNKKGYPTSKVLARTSKKVKHTAKTFEAFTFKEKAKVEKGKKYAIVLRSPLSNINHTYRWGGWSHSCFSSVKKEAYYKGDSFLSEDNGATWIHLGKEDNFCYADGLHKPIDFCFEVKVQPITYTPKKVTVPYIVDGKKTKDTIVAGKTVNIDYKIIAKGDYYFYLKPIFANKIYSVNAHVNLDPDGYNTHTGSFTWQWFNPATKNWESLTDQSSGVDFKYLTGDVKYDYIKLRLKMNIPQDTLYYANTTELNKIKQSDLWKTKVKDISTTPILKINHINFTIQCEPPTEAYLRTLFYHPEQDKMLRANIWSEVNAKARVMGNASVDIDIIHEQTATQHILFYNITDAELEPYFRSYVEYANLNLNFNVTNVLSVASEFQLWLQTLETPVYLLPYTDTSTNTDYIFFDDIELPHYPAYPLLGCRGGTQNIKLDLDDAKKISEYGFAFTFNYNVQKVLNGVDIAYYSADTNNETSSQEERDEFTLNQGTLASSYTNQIGAINSSAFSENDDSEEIDYAFTTDGKTIVFNLKSEKLKEIFEYNSTNNTVSYNWGDGAAAGYDFILDLSNKSYQEWIDYTVDYNNKTLTFADNLALTKGELDIEYHPLWIRGLSLADFPLNMDLWIENYVVNDGGTYKLLYDLSNAENIIDEDSFIATTNVNPYSKEVDSNDYYVIKTSVPARDNLRKVVVNEDTDNEEVLMEDRDYFVDYINNTVTFRKSLNDGDVITIRYTPNLTDTGLALAYRLHRPRYVDGVLTTGDTGVIRENDEECATSSNADDVYILDNYFTTRT